MHPDVVKALSWSDKSARKRLLRKLEENNVITAAEAAAANVVIQIRHQIHQQVQAKGGLDRQDAALNDLREQFRLSRTQFKALCKIARVCIADGKWYEDLAVKLKSRQYQVPRKTIKQYDHLKLCMLVSA
ncbi:MAG: hypothetical protein CL678_16695 [Bdellovibrionaceae bacterium]|nr:hypothetical protein [Pseudobdellovibrionaceae bacterium]